MTNFTLNKSMKTEITNKLLVKAVDKKLTAFEKKVKNLSEKFWNEHDAKVQDALKIDPSRYDDLIQKNFFRTAFSQSIYASRRSIANDSMAIAFRKLYHNRKPKGISSLGREVPRVQICLTHSRTVPTGDGIVEELTDKYEIKAKELMDEFTGIIKEAAKFLNDVSDILTPIRSYKRLLDVFPEAAKLVAPPDTKNGNMIPVELMESVRQRLATGIPT